MSAPSLTDLTVAVLHHGTPDLLLRCLELLAHHAQGARLLVIDSSGNAPVERLGPQVEYHAVTNHSMAHTANAGLRLATSPVVAHMNADVFIGPDTFPALLHELTQPNVALVGPVNRTATGERQPLGPLYRWHYLALQVGRSPSIAVPWIAGSLQVVRREAVEAVGGLDGSFRFYNEDLEWCLRLRRAGYRCRLVATDVTHLGGASTPQHPAFVVEGFRGGMRLSQRYLPRWWRQIQRRGVRLEALRRARFDSEPTMRSAYRRVAEMFAAGNFDDSPFGPTLDDR